MSGEFEELQSSVLDLEPTLGEVVASIQLADPFDSSSLKLATEMKDDLSSAVSCETLSDFRANIEAASQKYPLLVAALRAAKTAARKDKSAVAHLASALDALKPLKRELAETIDEIVEIESSDGNTEEEDEN